MVSQQLRVKTGSSASIGTLTAIVWVVVALPAVSRALQTFLEPERGDGIAVVVADRLVSA